MGSEFSNIWNLEEWACRTFPSTSIKEQICKFLEVIYLNVYRTNTAEWYAHPVFLLGSTEGDSVWQKGLSKSPCRRLGYPWENEIRMRNMRNMENVSEYFLHILPFVLCAQWPLIIFTVYLHLCAKPQPRNADLWKMVVQNQAGWRHCYKWFKKWSVNDSFSLYASIWYKTEVTRMA